MRHVKLSRLWKEAEKFKPQCVKVSDLSHVLSENVWGEKTFSLERFAYHMKKCLNADISKPPILVKERGEYFVLDGNHRISLLVASGKAEISAIVLPKEYNDWIIIG